MRSPWVFEKKQEPPILILDIKGLIGNALSQKLKGEATVVFVSQSEPESSEGIIHIPYKKVAEIPDNNYSHIFVIDEGDINKDVLSASLKKAKADRSLFLFATYVRSKNQEILTLIQESLSKAKIVFYGDVFDGKSSFKSIIDKFINQAKRGRIDVPGHGKKVIYPAFFDDVVEGLLEVTFGNSEDKIFYLFPEHRITLLSLAHIIQKINPEVKLDFVLRSGIPPSGIKSEEEEIILEPEGKFLLSSRYPLEARLKKLDIKVRAREESFEEKEDSNPYEFQIPKRTSYLSIFIFSLLFLIFLPFLSVQTFSVLGFKTLDIVRGYFEKGDFEKARKVASFSTTYFNLSEESFSLLDFELSLLGQKRKAKEIYKSISYGQNLSSAFALLFEGADLLSKKKSDFNSFKKAFTLLQNAKTQKTLNSSQIESLANFGSTSVDSWSQILGFDKPKNYLVLVNDNKISRPGGGIITSYATLLLDKGKVKEFSVHNPLEIDSKIEGKAEPPFAIRRYLKKERWSFEDTNFNVDFEESAKTSAFFLSLATRTKVDGVLSLDQNYFKSLEPILNGKNPTPFLIKDFPVSLENKDLLFAFSNPSIANLFKVNGWSSSLLDQREDKPSRFNDFLGIVEANFGKGDTISIKRKVFQKSKIGENRKISSQFLIEYENKSGEDYKNYLRIILPLGSKINKIKIGDEEKKLIDAITDPEIYEAKNFAPPKDLEIESYNQGGKSIFGFLLTVPKNQRLTVTIDYSLSNEVSPHFKSLTYNLKFFKQPGISYPFEFSLSFPDSFRAIGKSSIKTKISRDSEFSFNLSQK